MVLLRDTQSGTGKRKPVATKTAPKKIPKARNGAKKAVAPEQKASGASGSGGPLTNRNTYRYGPQSAAKFYLWKEPRVYVVVATIDLSSHQSIAQKHHFPVQEGCGNLDIPLHIRAANHKTTRTKRSDERDDER